MKNEFKKARGVEEVMMKMDENMMETDKSLMKLQSGVTPNGMQLKLVQSSKQRTGCWLWLRFKIRFDLAEDDDLGLTMKHGVSFMDQSFKITIIMITGWCLESSVLVPPLLSDLII